MMRSGGIGLFFAVLFLGTAVLHAAHAYAPSRHDRGAHSSCGHASVWCDPAFSTSALPRAADTLEGRAPSQLTPATMLSSKPVLLTTDPRTEPAPRWSAPLAAAPPYLALRSLRL